MASVGHTGVHIPQPLQSVLLMTATDLSPSFFIEMASNGQSGIQSSQPVHALASISAICGSVSSIPLLMFEYTLVAAERAELTVSIMVFGP